ncbi:MAG: hypothetical protein AB8F95_04050 [Bacteroidia bacterium]
MYIIKTKTDKSIGSLYPQVESISKNFTHLLNFHEIPEEQFTLEFKLKEGAILTDIISQASINANGLLINMKTRELISKFNLLKHAFLPVNVFVGSESLQYYWLHIADLDLINHIHYSKSKFYRTEFGFREEDLALESFEDYKIKKDLYGKNGTIEPDLLVVDQNIIDTYDLIAFPYHDNKIYISEILHAKLSENNITGAKYIKATSIQKLK